MEGIQVSTEVRGNQNQISVIKVGGFIDTTTSSEVERALNSLLKQNRYNIIIDLGNVDYISSAGWGIFISEIKSIREQSGDLKLVRMIPDVYEIFELLEFHHILDVYDSVEEAVDKFEESPEQIGTVSVTPQYQTTSVGSSQPDNSYMAQQQDYSTVEMDDQGEEPEAAGLSSNKDEVSEHSMEIEDKIKHIISRDPNIGAYKINKILNTRRYGYTKVGWFGVRSILNNLGLNSRKNRKEFSSRIMESDLR
jgi:anti-sigma B factor antagonist